MAIIWAVLAQIIADRALVRARETPSGRLHPIEKWLAEPFFNGLLEDLPAIKQNKKK